MAEGQTEPSGQQPPPLRTDDRLEEWIRSVAKAAALELVTRSDIEHLNKRIDDLRATIHHIVLPIVVAVLVGLFGILGTLVYIVLLLTGGLPR